MEKILKTIKKITLFIPILIISFSIKHVYAEAEDLDIYFAKECNSFNYSLDNCYGVPESSYSEKYQFSFSDSVNVILKSNANFSYTTLYVKDSNLYFTVSFNDNCSSDNSLNITNGSVKCGSSDNWSSTNTSMEYGFSLSSEDPTTFISTVWTDRTPSITSKNNIYLGQVSLRTWYFVRSYLSSKNASDFELVNTTVSDFYINGVQVERKQVIPEPEEPEPEEPEPEEPTPPLYNFNNNKYYVPNYHIGQCVEVIDKDTIRVFDDEFTSFYTDYYINSNYISKTGQVDLDYEKNCSSLQFTDIRYYGNDMPQILFILVCVLIFTIGFPYILYKRFRKR